MSVNNLYYNIYLNLQSQMGGVNPPLTDGEPINALWDFRPEDGEPDELIQILRDQIAQQAEQAEQAEQAQPAQQALEHFRAYIRKPEEDEWVNDPLFEEIETNRLIRVEQSRQDPQALEHFRAYISRPKEDEWVKDERFDDPL